jgi:hypothetical protein
MTVHQFDAGGSLGYCSDAEPFIGDNGRPVHFGTCPHPTLQGTFRTVSVHPIYPTWWPVIHERRN